jgi:hypothetical protein
MARMVTHVRLVKGTSNTKLLRFTADVAPGLVSIGSETGDSWLVTGEGVCGNHLELFWDGKALWVTETHHGEVAIDGEEVGSSPRRVYRGHVDFGACELLVDTVFAAEVRPLSPAQWEALREELQTEVIHRDELLAEEGTAPRPAAVRAFVA